MSTWLETLTAALGTPAPASDDPQEGSWHWGSAHVQLRREGWYVLRIDTVSDLFRWECGRPFSDTEILDACRLVGVLRECTCVDITPIHLPRRVRLVPNPAEPCPVHPASQPGEEAHADCHLWFTEQQQRIAALTDKLAEVAILADEAEGDPHNADSTVPAVDILAVIRGPSQPREGSLEDMRAAYVADYADKPCCCDTMPAGYPEQGITCGSCTAREIAVEPASLPLQEEQL